MLKSFIAPLIREDDVLGIIAPTREQYLLIKEKWLELVNNVIAEFISPYTDDEEKYIRSCKKLIENNVRLIVLDCIGYSSEVKNLVKSLTEIPVISARTALASYIKEIYL